MIRRIAGIVAIVGFAAIGLWYYGGHAPMGQDRHRYATYTGTHSGLLLSVEYPADWGLKEELGKMERFRQLRALGPRNARGTYTCYLALRASPSSPGDGPRRTVDDTVRQYTTHLFGDPTVLADRKTNVGSAAGRELVVSYTMPALHHKGLKAAATTVKTRRVFFEKDAYLYEFSYSADAGEFDRHEWALEHALKTIRFR